MSNENDNRVITRRGARQLSQDELDAISGAIPTRLTVLVTGTSSSPDRSTDT